MNHKNLFIIFSMIFFSLTFAMSDTDYAEDIDYLMGRGSNYYHERNYKEAKECFEQVVQQYADSPAKTIAQYYIGEMYYFGYVDGVGNDRQKAKAYFEQVTQATQIPGVPIGITLGTFYNVRRAKKAAMHFINMLNKK